MLVLAPGGVFVNRTIGMAVQRLLRFGRLVLVLVLVVGIAVAVLVGVGHAIGMGVRVEVFVGHGRVFARPRKQP